jgi:hypothetical protein
MSRLDVAEDMVVMFRGVLGLGAVCNLIYHM